LWSWTATQCRHAMNTKKLKKEFSAHYVNFFKSVVRSASAPHCFIWSGDFSNFYGGLSICSKIPFRFYVGLERISDDKFEVEEEILAYNPSKGKFEKIILDEYIVSGLKEELQRDFQGYRIKFFSELILGLSLGGLGAMSAAISVLLIGDQTKRPNFAQNLTKKLQKGRSSSATALCALSNSPYPVVVGFKTNELWAKGMEEIFKLPDTPMWPIDYGLIFSGNLVQGASVVASAEELKRVTLTRQNEMEEAIGYKFDSFWETYLNMLEQISGETLLSMKELFRCGNSKQNLKHFFSSLNQYQNLLHLVDISTSGVDEIYSSVHTMANARDNDVGSGCKITGVGRGGELLFAVPYGQYRSEIESLVDDLARERKGVNLDYASWRDGTELDGARIEQDIESKIFFDLIDGDLFLVTSFSHGKKLTRLADNKKSESILVIDLEENKIFYRGNKIDSKKIPSQKAACAILDLLLSSEDRVVLNNDLPKTYSLSRFDLQSKVTTPLERAFGFKFEISGTSFDKYQVTLKNIPDCTILRRVDS